MVGVAVGVVVGVGVGVVAGVAVGVAVVVVVEVVVVVGVVVMVGVGVVVVVEVAVGVAVGGELTVIDWLSPVQGIIDDTALTNRQRFVRLWLVRKEVEDADKRLSHELTVLEELLLEEFAGEGITSFRLDGITIYPQHALSTKPREGVDRVTVVRALEALGLGEFATYNANTLSSYVRELARTATGKETPSKEEAAAALPPALADILEINEYTNIRARRSP